MNYIFLINEKLANSAAQQITPTALHFQFFPDYYVRLLLPLFRSPPIFSSLRKKKHGSPRCFKVEREKREREKRRNLEKNLGITRNFPEHGAHTASKSRVAGRIECSVLAFYQIYHLGHGIFGKSNGGSSMLAAGRKWMPAV